MHNSDQSKPGMPLRHKYKQVSLTVPQSTYEKKSKLEFTLKCQKIEIFRYRVLLTSVVRVHVKEPNIDMKKQFFNFQ